MAKVKKNSLLADTDAMLEFYEEHYAEMVARGIDTTALLKKITTCVELDAAEARAREELERVKAEQDLRARRLWHAMILIYERAKIASLTNPELKRALDATGFEAFLAKGDAEAAAAEASDAEPVGEESLDEDPLDEEPSSQAKN